VTFRCGSEVLAPKLWTRQELKSAAILGLSTGLTSTFFYMAIDRLPLGKGVSIEFIGPITVAALFTRTKRNAIALVVAVVGVAILSGVELSGEPLGVLFIFIAAIFWGIHIVYAGKVANAHGGLDGLAMSFIFGALLTFPMGAPDIGAVITYPYLIGLGIVVGALASVTSYGIDQRNFAHCYRAPLLGALSDAAHCCHHLWLRGVSPNPAKLGTT